MSTKIQSKNFCLIVLLSKKYNVKLYRNVTLSDVYGCESRSFNFRAEIILTVFEKGVPREVLGHEGDEVSGGQRRPHDEEFHDVCSSPNIIHVIKPRRMRWAGQ